MSPMIANYPNISIIIPSYNAASTIRRALASLITQNYPNLQIICIDGASTDGTVDIIREYGTVISVLVSEKDKSIAEALNKGFRKATGELQGWLCADDEMAPEALSLFVEIFRTNPQADVVTGGCRRFYADGSEAITSPDPGFDAILSMKNGIEQPSTLWKRSLQERVGELDTTYKMAFDHELWCRFSESGAIFVTTDKILSHYHFSATNITSLGGRKLVNEMFRVTRKYGPWNGLVAYVFYFLYVSFDLKGYFDSNSAIPASKRRGFDSLMKLLRWIFGSIVIDNYNWNFASKQERALCWYK